MDENNSGDQFFGDSSGEGENDNAAYIGRSKNILFRQNKIGPVDHFGPGK